METPPDVTASDFAVGGGAVAIVGGGGVYVTSSFGGSWQNVYGSEPCDVGVDDRNLVWVMLVGVF